MAADSRPEIVIQFIPGQVAPETVQLKLDGVDITASAEVTADHVRYVPTEALCEGRHVVFVRANQASYTWTFVTSTPPQVADLVPNDLQLPTGARPTISARFSDVGSGIDVARTQIVILGGNYTEETDVSALAQITATGFELVPEAALADGRYVVNVAVFDRAGNPGLGYTHADFQVGAAPQFVRIEPGPDNVKIPRDAPRQIRVRFNSGGYPLAGYEFGVDELQTVVPEFEDVGHGNYVLSYLIPPTSETRHCFHVAVSNTKGLRSSVVQCFSIDVPAQRDVQSP